MGEIAVFPLCCCLTWVCWHRVAHKDFFFLLWWGNVALFFCLDCIFFFAVRQEVLPHISCSHWLSTSCPVEKRAPHINFFHMISFLFFYEDKNSPTRDVKSSTIKHLFKISIGKNAVLGAFYSGISPSKKKMGIKITIWEVSVLVQPSSPVFFMVQEPISRSVRDQSVLAALPFSTLELLCDVVNSCLAEECVKITQISTSSTIFFWILLQSFHPLLFQTFQDLLWWSSRPAMLPWAVWD